ncbi:MAG: hypothetical protein ACRCTL_01645, partial [Pseudomonas sp.]
MQPIIARPLQVAGIYLVFGITWILFSDLLLQALQLDAGTLSLLQTSKGLLFILLSGLFILLLSRHDLRTQQQLELGLRQHLLRLQQAQRDAGLGTWNYDGQLHWSPEALCLLERS